MTDKQIVALLVSARADLRKTQEGYKTHPNGTWWAKAMPKLDRAINELSVSPVPSLGKLWSGGKPLLAQDLTHKTGGIPLYPALDDAFNKNGGITILAPENITVRKGSSANPGDAFYAEGDSLIRYWFGHLVTAPAVGRRIKKGARVGVTLKHTVGGGPHVHVGVNVERLFGPGKQLLYGKTGTGPDYTHGSPTVGAQLASMLEA